MSDLIQARTKYKKLKDSLDKAQKKVTKAHGKAEEAGWDDQSLARFEHALEAVQTLDEEIAIAEADLRQGVTEALEEIKRLEQKAKELRSEAYQLEAKRDRVYASIWH
jgi:exonuclease VII small subunit